jgi:tetratricopeptide (TPR) repeat protein
MAIRVDEAQGLLAAARESRLVIFAGAGVSMAPPTNLPSWRDFNRSVVKALAHHAASIVTSELAERAATLVLTRHEQRKLPPEYQAQVLADLLHDDYFEVLQQLDSDRPNATHLAIAWLARLGYVRAVITTNFDRTLEAAFAAVDAPLERCYQSEHYVALARDLEQNDGQARPCRLLKLHGSVDDPHTLIDTLAQRKRGLAVPLLDCVRALLRSSHWLFLGYSGLDLEAEHNYLLLRPEADRAAGFTWFVRQNTSPLDVVVELKTLYGARAELVTGDLPEWLVDFTELLSGGTREWIAQRLGTSGAPISPDAAGLDESAGAWAARLSPERCALALTFVVMVCAEPQVAAELAGQLLASVEARNENTPGSLLLRAAAANAYGILIAALDRHADAVRWLQHSIDLSTEVGDPHSYYRAQFNLASSLEALGHVTDAREAYDRALSGFRRGEDPALIAHGLISLSSFSIRQAEYDEGRRFSEEAVDWATRGGDERARCTALFNLGKIARLQGDSTGALARYAEVEPLFARLGDDDAVAVVAADRAELLRQLGRFDEAERIQLETVRVSERLGRLDARATALIALGSIAQSRGDPAAAERWFTQAREGYHAIADPADEAFAALRAAQARLAAGAPRDAIVVAREALPLAQGRNGAVASDLWETIGKASLGLGQFDDAEEAYRHVREFALATNNRRTLAGATTNLGTVWLAQGRNPEALAALVEAAGLWRELEDRDNLAYCEFAVKALRLAERIASLAAVGQAASTEREAQTAALEQLQLYPDLIGMYGELGATAHVAGYCESAGNIARSLGLFDAAGRWFYRAADSFRSLGGADREREALDRSEELLRNWTNTLIDSGEFARALPDVLALSEVAERLGHNEMCASASLNAAIIVVRTSGDLARAKSLAERALERLPADSSDVATARAVIAHCEAATDRR